MTLRQASDALRLSRRRLRALIDAGDLPAEPDEDGKLRVPIDRLRRSLYYDSETSLEEREAIEALARGRDDTRA